MSFFNLKMAQIQYLLKHARWREIESTDDTATYGAFSIRSTIMILRLEICLMMDLDISLTAPFGLEVDLKNDSYCDCRLKLFI